MAQQATRVGKKRSPPRFRGCPAILDVLTAVPTPYPTVPLLLMRKDEQLLPDSQTFSAACLGGVCQAALIGGLVIVQAALDWQLNSGICGPCWRCITTFRIVLWRWPYLRSIYVGLDVYISCLREEFSICSLTKLSIIIYTERLIIDFLHLLIYRDACSFFHAARLR